MEMGEFLPLYSLRAPNIMWFLGAGASVAAGVPTAWDMIWDFKRTLYCATHKINVRLCQDLGDARLRARLQDYFDSTGGFPPEDSDEEYAFYFEALYPVEADRRRYIDQLVTQGKPSYGHYALASLLKLDKVRIIWSTNFDRMIEDATITVLGSSSKLVTVSLDNAPVALEALNEARWPLLVKLHGDFQSRRLKNTSDELRKQDAKLALALVEAGKRYGMAVVGYSGRDQSIMAALEQATECEGSFPAGLFWFSRSGSPLSGRVSRLISAAAARGIDAHVIKAETFDELMSDLLLLVPTLPSEIETVLNLQPRKVSEAPISPIEGTWPIIRSNALRMLAWPSVCRRVVCDIGGLREVRETIKKANADVIASRRKMGILAFGRDSEIRKAFDSHNISEFDIHPIAEKRLYFDSQELGLLYEALALAFQRECPVRVERRGRHYVVTVDQSRQEDPAYSVLKSAIGNLSGIVPNTNIGWREAVDIRLEFRLGRLWLLLEPSVWTDRSEDMAAGNATKEFVRERLAVRYNRLSNATIDGWIKVLTGGNGSRELRAFGIGDGIDAVFSLSDKTAYSERQRTI